MLTILTYRPDCDGKQALLEQIKCRAQAGQRSLLLVPESGSHQMERVLLICCGNRAGEYAQVTTFSKLTDDVLEEMGGNVRTMDGGGQVLTMYRALTAVRSSLQYYRKAAGPQLTEKLVEAAKELQACSVAPEALLRAETLSPKLHDLGLIYAQYMAFCQSGTLDPSARIDLAAAQLKNSGLVQNAEVFILGFEGFTAQKYAMLEEIMQASDGVTAALLQGRDKLVFGEQQKTKERLRRMAARNGIAVTVQEIKQGRAGQNASIATLGEELFDYQSLSQNECKGIALYDLPDPEIECEMAAALLRQKALSGVRLREMAVVCGDLEQYGSLLAAAFEKYELPLFLSEKTDLLQKPTMMAALGALEALEDGLSFESVIAWLRCGLCGIQRDDLDRLENYCFQWQIKGERWFTPFTAPTSGYERPSEKESALLEKMNEIRSVAAEYLHQLRAELAEASLGGQYASALKRHFEHFELEASLEKRCKALQLAGKGREAAEAAQLYQILSDALEQFSAAMETEPMTRREFLKLLKLMLRQYDVSSIPPSLDSVLAVTFQRLPEENLRHLVIIGGREGLFPPETPSLSMISEAERAALEGVGIELTQKAEERAWQQQCCAARAVSTPLETLAVTCPRRLSDGSPCRQSYLFRRIAQLRMVTPMRENVLEELRLTAQKPLLEMACKANSLSGSDAEKTALSTTKMQPEQDAFLQKLREYDHAPRGPVQDPALVQQLYGQQLRMTASRLEKVSACRFSYFMQYGLKAKPLRQARFDAPQVGTFVHYVVEHAIQELCRAKDALPEAAAAKYVNRYLEEKLPPGPKSARFLALFEEAGRLACEIVRNVWEEIQAGDFRPVCFELNFSSNQGDLPPLSLKEGDITLTVSGKIDRVDGYIRGDTLYLKVVDYKTGRKAFHLSDVLYGLNLQMFLYLMMLEQSDLSQLKQVSGQSEITKMESCGALYIPAKSPCLSREPGESDKEFRVRLDKELRRIGLVRDDSDLLEAMERGGSFRFLPVDRKKDGSFTAASSVASAQQLGRLLRKTEEALRKIARLVSSGDVEADPYRTGRDESICRFCDFQAACHFDPSMGKDRLRYLPPLQPNEVHRVLEQEEQERKTAWKAEEEMQ